MTAKCKIGDGPGTFQTFFRLPYLFDYKPSDFYTN